MGALDGKKVVVIGGSYGIGYASAEMAIEAGADIVIAARGAEKLKAAAASLEQHGGRAVAWSAFCIEDRPKVAEFLAECAPFDHLVMPGSTVKPVLYDELTDTDAREAFESKFWGPFWAAFDGRGHMNKGGSVVFFTGVAAKRPVKGYVMGGAINGALNAATRSLALEFAPYGIRVNAVAPGMTDTPLQDILHGHDKQERYDHFSARLPVGRIGTARECALGVIYLLTNGFATGQVLGIDGGHECMP